MSTVLEMMRDEVAGGEENDIILSFHTYTYHLILLGQII